MAAKLCKLVFHQKSQQKAYSGEELVLCAREFPTIKEGDILEIHVPDDSELSIVFKISKTALREDFTVKDTISIDQTIATAFQLKTSLDVILSIVDPSLVELDSIELTFKDQYLGRSEMWRLKTDLEGSCVYTGKKLEFCSGTIRCQVHEIWTAGSIVTSGMVTDNTKIVYRSSTSMVYLFIQMSSEMWEFDIYGDLYFEKAVNGFLSELFAKWKKNGSTHEVTIVLFSRVFYHIASCDHLPQAMKECVLADYQGRFYEDFYRVVVQNEKYEDWGNTLIHLRQVFVEYHDYLINFHKSKFPHVKCPKAFVSSAAQGNFLEVLNMSLNVFEKHFVDRSFERTGQLSVVITPGVGVFEVDRELTNVTMQRIIDNGVGSDLVCVGEQPLHAVPLLKFHNKATHHEVDDYSMPHWINLSFYSKNKRVGYATFIPRIKLPPRTPVAQYGDVSNSPYWKIPKCFSISAMRFTDEPTWPNSVYDFESYDDNIFKLSQTQTSTKRRARQIKRYKNYVDDDDFSKMFLRQNSEPEIHASDLYSSNSSIVTGSSSLVLSQPSSAITIPSKVRFKATQNVYSSSFGALNIEPTTTHVTGQRAAHTPINDRWIMDDSMFQRNDMSSPTPSSHGDSPKEKDATTKFAEFRRPSRSLINPFDPSHAVIKLTSNRRRWTHIFPRGPSGALIQHHHFNSSGLKRLDMVPEGEATLGHDADARMAQTRQRESPDIAYSTTKKVTRLWGATGEQEWTPALTTGVDWKSLTIPACLPLTTDYFPDERSLQTDYLFSDYNLLPDDVNADYSSQRAIDRKPLTTKEVFYELVSQRLAQGFQCVIRQKVTKSSMKHNSALSRAKNVEDNVEEYFLSIGRIFHRITLSSSTITVTRYRPRHPYPAINVHYKFRFYAPNNNNFEVSYADFTTEKLENYNWNYLDHYICTRGDKDFALTENLKYWRLKMLILPTSQATPKKILADTENAPCNIYEPFKLEEKRSSIQDFLKFIEICINRIRRPNNSIPKSHRGPSGGSIGSTSSGTFRERVNSNQLTERPRIKSGSKLMEKQRHESAGGRVSPFDATFGQDMKGNYIGSSEPILELVQSATAPVSRQGSGEITPMLHLQSNAPYIEIVTAMKTQSLGLSFIKSSDLPAWTFVSYDAIMWLLNHMEGVDSDVEAANVLNGMLNAGVILHASEGSYSYQGPRELFGKQKHPGDSNQTILNGFYLYHIVARDAEALQMEPLVPPSFSDPTLFSNEWMEVDVPFGKDLETDAVQNLLASQERIDYPLHLLKDIYLDVDVSKKSDRQEWGHLRYQSLFKPDEAFEITVHWIQATGAIVADLVQSWSRKAQQCNLQLVPAPTDPFALPVSSNSDPLRGPISIKVDVDQLPDFPDIELSSEQKEDWKMELPPAGIIIYFQHKVALAFGFLLCSHYTPLAHSNVSSNTQKGGGLHYVHSSGNMFLMVPAYPVDGEINFLWSWNYLVSKRWRTSSTPALGDDGFMFKVLHDFKSFCTNDDNRLVEFWNMTFDA